MLLDGKVVLVTGGTGSLGKIFVRRVLTGEFGTPRKLVVLSRDEAKQNEMRLSYLNRFAATDEVIYRNFMHTLEFRIGDVRRYEDVCSALRGVDFVVNAAALKQVPTCEYFPVQAMLTNCQGAANLVRAVEELQLPVEAVVGVSTDKAAKPVNVMGMTKAVQERIFISANVLNRKTRFVCVRYGNVLASRGSVIPLFHEQIRRGGPVTITVPGMTRFLLSLNDAVDTVIEALRSARPGETYVPAVPSATVENLVKAMIGDRRTPVKTIGIRPGEKIHEILVSEEEAHRTVRRGGYYAVRPMLPELRAEDNEPAALTAELSSANAVIDLPATTELLRTHGLLPSDRDFVYEEELLR